MGRVDLFFRSLALIPFEAVQKIPSMSRKCLSEGAQQGASPHASASGVSASASAASEGAVSASFSAWLSMRLRAPQSPVSLAISSKNVHHSILATLYEPCKTAARRAFVHSFGSIPRAIQPQTFSRHSNP